MHDSTARMPHAEFVAAIPLRVLTDEEIAEKITSYQRSGAEELELAQALQKYAGGGPLTGPIRTAVRASRGLPPIPGD